MSHGLQNPVLSPEGARLSRAFSRLGWVGFWLQAAVGSLLAVGMVSFFVFSRSVTVSGRGLPFVEYLTLINFLMLCFTTFWSFRYTMLARQMNDPERRPPAAAVVKAAWTGTTASVIGMLFSMIVILLEAGSLLFLFLKSPQAGVPVIQTPGGEASHWASSIDMVSLMALILVLFAELIVLMFSLWLLFRASQQAQALSPDAAKGADGDRPGDARFRPGDAR
jgi:hypothetical protein